MCVGFSESKLRGTAKYTRSNCHIMYVPMMTSPNFTQLGKTKFQSFHEYVKTLTEASFALIGRMTARYCLFMGNTSIRRTIRRLKQHWHHATTFTTKYRKENLKFQRVAFQTLKSNSNILVSRFRCASSSTKKVSTPQSMDLKK